MGKSEQLNLRISSSLKEQLSKVAEDQNISMSDFIRETLEERIEGNQQTMQQIERLEEKLQRDWQKMFRSLLYAAATIVNIDTDLPLDQCLATAIRVFEEETDLDFADLFQLPRDDMEKIYLGIQERIAKEVGLSDLGRTFVSIMFSGVNGLRYQEHVFDTSPLSVKTLELIRLQLRK